MEKLWMETYGSTDYVQTLALGGGGTSSAGRFLPSFSFLFLSLSFSFSCLLTHCKLDRYAS